MSTSFSDSLSFSQEHEIIASVHCPIAARMASDLGFKYGIIGGSIASMSMIGSPDLMLLTLTELSDLVRRTCQASALSIIVDGDAGYGNALNVIRTVQELEYAAASAVTLEDTKLPIAYNQKIPEIVSKEEQLAKLSAALDARKSPSFGIIARTQILPGEPIETVANRVALYSSIDVDAVCLVGLSDANQLRAISLSTDKPLMIITYEQINSIDQETLHECNVKLILTGHSAFEESIAGTYNALASLSGKNPVENQKIFKEIAGKYINQQSHDIAMKKYLSI